MSVIAMLGLSYAWLVSLHETVPSAMGWAYADNWSWATEPIDSHIPILQLTVQFVQTTKMIIDWNKTWTWSVMAKQENRLDAVVSQFTTTKVRHCSSAMELGCQFTYRGLPVLGQFQERLRKLHARLSLLQYLPHDMKVKAMLVMGGIYSVGFYGVELLPVGMIHLDNARTAVATAVLGECRNRNSAISVACVPHVLDPLVYVIMKCISAAQRYLLKVDAHNRQEFYEIAATHSGKSNQCHGPAGTLTYYLRKIGWSLDRRGCLCTDQFVTFDLLTTSHKTLQLWVERAWTRDLLTLHSTRAILNYMQLDVISTVQVLSRFSVFQQKCFKKLGVHTRRNSRKLNGHQMVTGLCLHCPEEDTKEHRLFHCEATAGIRAEFQPLLNRYAEYSLIHELPAMFVHEDSHTLQLLNHERVEAQLDDHFKRTVNNWIGQGYTPRQPGTILAHFKHMTCVCVSGLCRQVLLFFLTTIQTLLGTAIFLAVL